jgi:hypothetical protein
MREPERHCRLAVLDANCCVTLARPAGLQGRVHVDEEKDLSPQLKRPCIDDCHGLESRGNSSRVMVVARLARLGFLPLEENANCRQLEQGLLIHC